MDRSQVTVASTVASTVTTVAADKLAGRDPGSGTRLGDFTLLRQLGRGAQGEVYEARDELLGRLVALKVLPPYLTFNPERVQRFKREAEAGGRLDHPNTVGVHSVGERDGYHYISQELVAGGRTLGDEIAAGRAQPELPRDWFERMAHVFVQVAEAVHAAHEAGIIHRDLKPGNILLTPDGQPKVADFGLAMVLDDLHRSRSGELIGTPFYMSPEQATGGRGGLDRRTDVFSLGTTLYEALTLGRPFDGETRDQVIERIQLHDPPDPRKIRPSVPRDLAVICMKALEKRCDRRFQSADEFASELGRYLRHEPILVRPPGVVMRAGKWLQRHPVGSSFGAAFLLVVALLVHSFRQEEQLQASLEYSNQQEADLRAFAEIAVRDLFESLAHIEMPRTPPEPSSPILQRIESVTAQAALLKRQPELQAHLLTVAGSSYAQVSMFDRAEACLDQALEAVGRMSAGDPEVVEVHARVLAQLGLLCRWTGDWARAESVLTESRSLFAQVDGEVSEEVFGPTRDLAIVLFRVGRTDEAEALLRDFVATGDWPDVVAPVPLAAIKQLGALLIESGQLEEAFELLQPAYARSAGTLPAPERAQWGSLLALLHDRRGRSAAPLDPLRAAQEDAEAERLFVESIAQLRLQRPDPSERTADALADYGSFLTARMRYAEARAVLDEAIHMGVMALGPSHYATQHARNNLAFLDNREGRFEAAEAGWLEVIDSDRLAMTADPRAVHVAFYNLANFYARHDRLPEALALATEQVARTPPGDRELAKRREQLEQIEARLRAAASKPQ